MISLREHLKEHGVSMDTDIPPENVESFTRLANDYEWCARSGGERNPRDVLGDIINNFASNATTPAADKPLQTHACDPYEEHNKNPTVEQLISKVAKHIDDVEGGKGADKLPYLIGENNVTVTNPIISLRERLKERQVKVNTKIPPDKIAYFTDLVQQYADSAIQAGDEQEAILSEIVSALSQLQQTASFQNQGGATLFRQQQPPLILEDAEGDNYVTGITRNDERGCYVIHGKNSFNQPRLINVYDDGSVTGYNDISVSKLGVVEQQLHANMHAIFNHFRAPLPEKQRDPQVFTGQRVHLGGNNYATGISRDNKNGCYVMRAINNKGQQRLIHVYDDGNVTGYNNQPLSGYVEQKLHANMHTIFNHFRTPLPQSYQSIPQTGRPR